VYLRSSLGTSAAKAVSKITEKRYQGVTLKNVNIRHDRNREFGRTDK
jgi:hypothetical protein